MARILVSLGPVAACFTATEPRQTPVGEADASTRAATAAPSPKTTPPRRLRKADSVAPGACDVSLGTTWDPANTDSLLLLADGNTTVSGETAASRSSARANQSKTIGKWYWEVTIRDGSPVIGAGTGAAPLSGTFLGEDTNGWSYSPTTMQRYDGHWVGRDWFYGLPQGRGIAGDVIGVALDIDDGTIAFYKNGVAMGPASTPGPAWNGIPTGTPIYPMVGGADTLFSVTTQFAPPFAYAIPDGFAAFDCDICGGIDQACCKDGPVRTCSTGAACDRASNICLSSCSAHVTLDPANTGAPIVLSSGNLEALDNTYFTRSATRVTQSKSAGKWYWEVTLEDNSPPGYPMHCDPMVGVGTAAQSLTGNYIGVDKSGWGYLPASTELFHDVLSGHGVSQYGRSAPAKAGDVIGVALDIDGGTLTFYNNGVSLGTAFTDIPSGTPLYPMLGEADDMLFAKLKLQAPFKYQPPYGFAAYGSADDGTSCSGGLVCGAGSCVPATCTNTPIGTYDNMLTLSVSDQSPVGPVTYVQTNTTLLFSPPKGTTTISISGQPQYTVTTGPGSSYGSTQTTVVFGSAFHGVREIDAVTDGQTVNATIDGRAIVPMPLSAFQNVNPASPPTLTFADGSPFPVVTVDDGVLDALNAISQQAKGASSQCQNPTAAAPGSPFDPTNFAFERGHFSDPFVTPQCNSARDHCTKLFWACNVGADTAAGIGIALAVMTANPAIGAGWVLVLGAISILGSEVACNGVTQPCYDQTVVTGAACHPVDCGSQSSCDYGETCLDPSNGSCCGPGYTKCNGPVGESCVDVALGGICLASGQGCAIGTPTCGSGATEVCCPSGACAADGSCMPPTDFGITATLQTTMGGPNLCIHGAGFTNQAMATVTLSRIPTPGPSCGFATQTPATVQVDANGNVGFTQLGTIGGAVACCPGQTDNGQVVTITVQDGTKPVIGQNNIGTGATATTTLPANFWCTTALTGGGTGTCP